MYVLSLRRCRQSGQAVGKPTELVRLELMTMPFAGICSTTELPVHIRLVAHVIIIIIIITTFKLIKALCLYMAVPYKRYFC